jgi:ABC-type branched-subunit amino acid transport system ATPase component
VPLALEILALSKRYVAGIRGCRAVVHALRDVDLAVAPGEIVVVAGPVGAGKTTLLLCAAGLLRPDAGSIAWFGRIRAEPPPARRAAPRFVAYLSGDAPLPSGTARELLQRAARRTGAAARNARRATAEALSGAALEACADLPVDRLAVDVRRRLRLARALLARPSLLLIDEPLGSRAGGAGHANGDAAVGSWLCQLAADGVSIVLAVGDDAEPITPPACVLALRSGRVSVPPAGCAPESRQSVRVRVAESAPRTGE